MLWGGRWEGGSCLGMHVRIKDFKIKKNKKLKKKKKSATDMLNLKIKQNHARYSFKTIKDRETVETKLNQKTKVPMLISDTGLSMYNN